MKRFLVLVALFLINPSYALPNPASVYCIHHGGTLNVTGDLSGICLFRDHSYCEEWSYFRGVCKPGEYFLPEKIKGARYCTAHVGKNSIVYLCNSK
ncbi:MAG: DUF333 domain-containing protein [Pseudomonadota bacterium]